MALHKLFWEATTSVIISLSTHVLRSNFDYAKEFSFQLTFGKRFSKSQHQHLLKNRTNKALKKSTNIVDVTVATYNKKRNLTRFSETFFFQLLPGP